MNWEVCRTRDRQTDRQTETQTRTHTQRQREKADFKGKQALQALSGAYSKGIDLTVLDFRLRPLLNESHAFTHSPGTLTKQEARMVGVVGGGSLARQPSNYASWSQRRL